MLLRDFGSTQQIDDLRLHTVWASPRRFCLAQTDTSILTNPGTNTGTAEFGNSFSFFTLTLGRGSQQKFRVEGRESQVGLKEENVSGNLGLKEENP